MLSILEKLTPHARVATAVMPFILAMVLRIVFGRSAFTRVLLSAATMWFVVNVLLAPYSVGMRQDIHQLEHYFR